MRLSTTSFEDGGQIPARYAFARPADEGHVTLSDNLSPALSWSEVPEGTKSFALTCHDPDAPSERDDANKEDREIAADLERVDFYHWVVVDLPPDIRSIEEGEFSSGVTVGGKRGGEGPHGCREGINDYTGWFEGDAEMQGDYHGYDGPGPPWNDSIVHRYVFTLHALDFERTSVMGSFTGEQVLEAIRGHVIESATLTGTYTQNPRLLA
jgi:Raf kinase inhibitor-like YbhB/YbcL family protein